MIIELNIINCEIDHENNEERWLKRQRIEDMTTFLTKLKKWSKTELIFK